MSTTQIIFLSFFKPPLVPREFFMNTRPLRAGLLIATTGLFSLASSPAEILLNEVFVNPEGNPDNNAEFIELISTTGGVESTDGLTIVIADQNGGKIGKIEASVSLNGLSTGENGLLLIGSGYSRTNPPENAQVPLETEIAAVLGIGSENGISPNGGVALFLVRGFSGNIGDDLDGDDDGNLNAASTLPWTQIVDVAGFRDRTESGFAGINFFVGATNFAPDAFAREVGNFSAINADAWFGGERLGDSNESLDPAKYFGMMLNGAITRGAPNIPVTPANLLINEVSVNPPGGDDNFEFIEIINTDGGIASTQGHHLVIINTDDGVNGANCRSDRTLGVIVEALSLDDFNTGANGLLLLGDGYDNQSPWENFVDPLTELADPLGLGDDNIGNEIGVTVGSECVSERTNDGFTLLLVKGYDAPIGMDIDTNDDGVIDDTPWTEIVDSIGYGKLNGDQNGNDTGTYALADVSQAPDTGFGYQPDAFARVAGDTAANSAASWYGGDFGGTDSRSVAFARGDSFGGFIGSATPGRTNLSAASPPASLILSEVTTDNPQDDGEIETNAEFVEIFSPDGGIAPLSGYTLLVVNTDNGNRGDVVSFYDLTPYSTGENGLLLFGDDFDNSERVDVFGEGTVRSKTSVGDEPEGLPTKFQKGVLPDGPTAILLVTGFDSTDNASLSIDLDADDDGSVDSGLGFTIVDGITIGQLSHPNIADLTQAGYVPGTFSRRSGLNTPGDVAAWTGGRIQGPSFASLIYSETEFFGAFRSGVTPGQANHAGQPYTGERRINEVHIDPPGDDDDNFEYIEILSTNLSNRSLNGLSLLVVDTFPGSDAMGNTGDVRLALDLDGFATGDNGIFLMGDDYDDSMPSGGPYAALVESLTSVGDPEGLGRDDIGGNDGLAFFLVTGSTAQEGDDLDTNTSTTGGDGMIDTMPWDSVTDSISFGTHDYGAPQVSLPMANPGNISRAAGRTMANSADVWYGGLISGSVSTGTAFSTQAGGFFDNSMLLTEPGFATPGQRNLGEIPNTDFEDPDGDGVFNILELAMATNPNSSDPELFPTASAVGADSVFSFRIASGSTGNSTAGFSVGGTRVVVELSSNLVTWTTATASDLGTQTVSAGAGFDQISVPIIEGANPRRFARLSAERE